MLPGQLTWAAPERNKGPILGVLEQVLGEGLVLEVGAGTGQHAVHFAAHLPRVQWQPTERDPELLDVIRARVTTSQLANLRPPFALDVCSPAWPALTPQAVFSANLIHVAPWSATEALVRGAGRVLARDGLLVTYGPYRVDKKHTAPSNAEFDASLKVRNPDWGVRDLDEVDGAARSSGLVLERRFEMPANNLLVVWRRP